MKKYKYYIRIISICFGLMQISCVSTRVEASPYQDTMENVECQTRSNWSYLWGLVVKKVDVNPATEGVLCPCREEAMTWVEVKTSTTDFLLTLITLGTVNHRSVSYGCSRPTGGDGGLDN
ncbi:hypothetical protein [Christiangramia crocea]|uniref:Uncharacterized protein n=1 Tax=Christiangramia crocea TaxID=2904124 RepID=A0A9X1UY70_9FLAO|nr:hypothetical protein [Gramella crocea]MCG9972577.1 hypothetical protein [Gramella crocea]